jgi:hypothetical protein
VCIDQGNFLINNELKVNCDASDDADDYVGGSDDANDG